MVLIDRRKPSAFIPTVSCHTIVVVISSNFYATAASASGMEKNHRESLFTNILH